MSENRRESAQIDTDKERAEERRRLFEEHMAQPHPSISDRGWEKIWEAEQIYGKVPS